MEFTCMKKVLLNIWEKMVSIYHDLYGQGNKLLLTNLFNILGHMCFGIYESDPAHFLSASGLG